MKSTPTQPKPKTTAPQKVNRIYKEDMYIDSDTFKLEVENYAKNVSFDDKKPLMVGIEHCHFFHSYDSSGKKMQHCNAVGGHTHEVKIEVDANGNMFATCGPAISNKPYKDDHIHQVTYVKSDRFKVRSINQDAQMAIASYTKI